MSSRNFMHLAKSIPTLAIARILFGVSLLWRITERMYFVYAVNSEYPEIYGSGFPLGLLSGSFSQQVIFHLILLGLTLNFTLAKSFLSFTSFSLFFLIAVTNQDQVYIGKGILVFLPLLLIWGLTAEKFENRFQRCSIFCFSLFLGSAYFFSAFHKSDPSWLDNGQALSLFFQTKQISTDLGVKLLALIPSEWFVFLSKATILLEYSVLPLLLFFEFKRKLSFFLKIVIICFILFHSILFITTILKSFSLAMISCWILIYALKLKKTLRLSLEPPRPSFKELSVWLYIFTSIILWNMSPSIFKNNATLKNFLIPQRWSIVAPSPGYYNYKYLIYNSKKDLIFDSDSVITSQFKAAFITALQKDKRVRDIFLQKQCGGEAFLQTRLLQEPKLNQNIHRENKVVTQEKFICR